MAAELPAGARIATGIAVALVGAGIVALGLLKENALMAVPAGLCFVFGGALVLVPPGRRKLQLLLGTLVVTSLAATFDWVAFGPGERQFTMSVGGAGASASWRAGEWAGRAFFGFFALLFDVAALGLWIRLARERFAMPKEQHE